MLITIDTEEALKFSLSIQDLAVLDVMRRLLAADGGAVETNGNRQYKWLSNSTILHHLQCSSFRSPRQLHNIINKLCSVGLLIKKMWYGKPYYSAILRKKAATAAPRQNRAAAPNVAAPVPRAVAPTVAAAPSVPGTSAAPTVAPSVPRRVDAPTVAAAPVVPSVPPSLQDGSTTEPTPEEVRAALAAIDQKTAEHEKRAAAVIEKRKAAFAATIQKLVPSVQMLRDYAKEMQWQDFDLDGFITFNTERNWSALRKRTWKQLATQWYDQQCKKMSELITYEKYCELCTRDHRNGQIWKWHHKDPKTGISYYSRVQSAAIVGGASPAASTQGAQKNAAPPDAPNERDGKRYMDVLKSQPKAAPGNNPQR